MVWPPHAVGWAAVILVTGGVLTGWFYELTLQYEDAVAIRQFRAEAQVISRDAKDIFRRSAGLTNTAAALVQSLPRLDTMSWRKFVADVHAFDSTEGLVGYGIAHQVSSTAVDGFSEQMRREGQGGVHIFPGTGEGPYWPVTYAEPEELRRRAIGFDLGSEPTRRRALLRARDSGEAAMSGIISVNFLDEERTPPGYLMFYPMYFGDTEPHGEAERRARIQGFALAVYRFDKLLDGIANSGHGRYGLSLFDMEAEEPRLAFRSNVAGGMPDGEFSQQIDFVVCNHPWRIEVVATQTYARQIGHQRSTLALTLGGFLSLVAAGLFYLLASGRQRAEAAARRMTAELRVSEERFRALTTLSSDWYWEQDQNYRFTAIVSGGRFDSLDVPAAIGKCRWELVGDLSEQEWQAHRAVLDRRQPFRGFEFRVRRDSGEWRWRSVSGEPMVAADGQFCGYRGTGRDITERKEFETQLALKSFALDHIHEQAHLFDADQQIIYVNEESCRALGYRREELTALSIFDFDPDITIEQFAELQDRMRVAGHATLESRHRRKDGSTFPVEIDVSVFAFDGHDFVLTLTKDITERRRQEEELRRHRDHLQEMVAAQTGGLLRAKDEAQQANRAKSEFLANVTHELRTPMHAILSYANLGRDRQGQVAVDKLAGYFDHIRDSGERLLVLIDELLDLSKLEAGCMLLERRPLQAADLCRDVVRELTPLWSARQQHIDLRASDGIGVIQADPDRVAQVVRNLLANAIRFSPEGSEITVSLTPAILPGRRADDHGSIPALRITVADLGVGIPEAELEAIFDAFVQSSRTRTGAGGTGLGLAICRQVVHAHHGRIRAQNRPEGGTEFEVLLPTH